MNSVLLLSGHVLSTKDAVVLRLDHPDVELRIIKTIAKGTADQRDSALTKVLVLKLNRNFIQIPTQKVHAKK